MPKSLTESKRLEIMRQYVAGVPTAQIAKDFGVSHSYPSQLAARYDIKRRVQHTRDPMAKIARRALADCLVDEIAKPPPMNVNSAAEVRRLAAMGKGRTQIAALLRCPYRLVDEALS